MIAGETCSSLFLLRRRIQGEGADSPAPIRPTACLRTEILTSKGSYITFQLADFVMKRTLHFATKLNFRDIKKCNCFSVPSYDLFASAHKAVFPALTTTGVHRLRKTWSSLLSQLITKKVQQAFLNQSLPPPPPCPQSKIPGSAPASLGQDVLSVSALRGPS